MTDPVGLISASGGAYDPRRAGAAAGRLRDPEGPSFKDALLMDT